MMDEPSQNGDETISSDGQHTSGKCADDWIAPTSVITEGPGSVLGPYKLLEQLGEGSFGVVFLAEQSKPIKRRVALKIIKPGMDTKEVIARFEAERQALALMDHPNIAKVLDAGSTDTGRPYFAMELVKGVPVTEYCDTHRLDTKQRLELFRDICAAVQHAHQKGIIHRDLKPANILVALPESKPAIKVIDFGIAKAISQELTEKTLFTAHGQMIGTPNYMSPEQSEMSGLDIDTRSDIYSLGVVLYELLTGKTPLDLQQLRQAGLDEIHRLIREVEAPKPSTRLGSLSNEENTVIAKAHNAAPEKLNRLVQGDLDWIVMKALEKDRGRRYETATEFAADIGNYLTNQPVLASPPSTRYRMGKFVRRNKVALATVTLVFAIMMVATVVSIWQAVRATKAETVAEAERELAKQSAGEAAEAQTRAEQSAAEATEAKTLAEQSARDSKAVLKFFETKVLVAARPKGQTGGLGIKTTISEAINAAEPKIGAAFADQPLVEASIRDTMGLTYYYLGELNVAVSQQERALKLRTEEQGIEHTDRIAAMDRLAESYHAIGRYQDVQALREEALILRKKVLGPEHSLTMYSMYALANAYNYGGYEGRYEEAAALHKETVALKKKVLGPEHSSTLYSMSALARSYRFLGRYKEAVTIYKETLALQTKVHGADDLNTLITMSGLALIYRAAGRHEEAVAMFEESLKIARQGQNFESAQIFALMTELALSYRLAGRNKEGLAMHKETLALRKKVVGIEHPETLESMTYLARAYYEAGRIDESLVMRKKVLILRKRVLGPEHMRTIFLMYELALSYRELSRYEEAEKQWLETIPLMEKKKSGYLSLAITGLVELYKDYWDKPEKAKEWQAKLDALKKAE